MVNLYSVPRCMLVLKDRDVVLAVNVSKCLQYVNSNKDTYLQMIINWNARCWYSLGIKVQSKKHVPETINPI